MRSAAVGLVLLLAACSEGQPQPSGQSEATTTPAAAQPSKPLEFAGRWAVSPAMCGNGWWDFGAGQIVTAGELACSVTHDERTETTATLRLACIGEGMKSDETWRLHAESGGRLSVTRDAAAPIVLERCPAN